MKAIEWRFTAFDDLTVAELYAVLQLRSAVFVVEQSCIFQDMDGADAQAMHLLGTLNGRLVAYARCFAAGVQFPEASIGRVLTCPGVRGGGTGHALIEKALACMSVQLGAQPVRIGAQAHLQVFYRQHGFEKSGPAYLEDGIAHVSMLRGV